MATDRYRPFPQRASGSGEFAEPGRIADLRRRLSVEPPGRHSLVATVWISLGDVRTYSVYWRSQRVCRWVLDFGSDVGFGRVSRNLGARMFGSILSRGFLMDFL